MYTFTVNSGKLQVTDPYYDLNTWCTATLENVKNGKYIAETTKKDEGMWGDRISELRIYHESVYPMKKRLKFAWRDSNIGVDSGQAGFFDYASLYAVKINEQLDDSFYKHMCELTSDSDYMGVNEFGAVSSSGYGDGVYSLHTAEKNGEIVAAKIIFIDENNKEMEGF